MPLFTDLVFESDKVAGGERFTLIVDGIEYLFRFDLPLQTSVEVALQSLSDGITYDGRNQGRWRATSLPYGMRLWSSVDDERLTITVSSSSLRIAVRDVPQSETRKFRVRPPLEKEQTQIRAARERARRRESERSLA